MNKFAVLAEAIDYDLMLKEAGKGKNVMQFFDGIYRGASKGFKTGQKLDRKAFGKELHKFINSKGIKHNYSKQEMDEAINHYFKHNYGSGTEAVAKNTGSRVQRAGKMVRKTKADLATANNTIRNRTIGGVVGAVGLGGAGYALGRASGNTQNR